MSSLGVRTSALGLYLFQLGLTIGVLGPMLPRIADSYTELSKGVIGLIITSYFCGATIGTIVQLVLIERRSAATFVRVGAAARQLAIAAAATTDGTAAAAAPVSPFALTAVVATPAPHSMALSLSDRTVTAASGEVQSPISAVVGQHFESDLDDEVLANQSYVRVALTGASLISFAIWFLPSTVSGSSSGSFVIYILLVCGLGVNGGVGLCALSGVLSSWNIRTSGRAVSLTNLMFSVGAVAAPWVQRAFLLVDRYEFDLEPAHVPDKFYFLPLALCQACVGAVLWAVDLRDDSHLHDSTPLRLPLPPPNSVAISISSPPAPHRTSPSPSPSPPASLIGIIGGVSGVRRSGYRRRRHASIHDRIVQHTKAVNDQRNVDLAFQPLVRTTSLTGSDVPSVSSPKQYTYDLFHDVRYWMLLVSMCCSNGAAMVSGSWMYNLSIEAGMSETSATLASSVYWFAFLCGRVFTSWLNTSTHATTSRSLITAAIAGTAMPIGIAITGDTTIGVLVFGALCGWSFASLYPSLITLEIQCQLFANPKTHSNAIAMAGIVISSQIGALVMPTLFSAIAGATSIRITFLVAAAAMAVATACLIVFVHYSQVNESENASQTTVRALSPQPASAAVELPATAVVPWEQNGASAVVVVSSAVAPAIALPPPPPTAATNLGPALHTPF